MNDFFKSQLEELRENKLRVGLLAIILFATIIYAVSVELDTGEEIITDEPQKISEVEEPVKVTSSVSSDKVKPVIGANVDEIFIHNPFNNPAPAKIPAKVEEKIIPPAEPVIITPPVVEEPKPPEIKFVLQGVALGDEKTAIVEKIESGKVEILFVTIGDNLNGKIIVGMESNNIILDNGDKLYIKSN